MITNQIPTKYGVAIGLFVGNSVYMSRRIDEKAYSKKWQFINGYMGVEEVSSEATAIRVILNETGIEITPDRLHSIPNIDFTDETYYVYLVHLNDDEIPYAQVVDFTKPMAHSDWKLFPLEKAVQLDLVPGLRTVLRKLFKTFVEYQTDLKKKANKIVLPFQDINENEFYAC